MSKIYGTIPLANGRLLAITNKDVADLIDQFSTDRERLKAEVAEWREKYEALSKAQP